ncbi:glycolate oxidase subunit GlcF [Enterovibrio coralii]|uniref:Glycolate oxidase iron-sulfur subunit n=1 Tax=Enterovibrio coralii TaxID=294935 RepID=A0A135ICB3_9GAMM|nr:glycolate oxidase subunit GlcF [Enterovibrio coralii]KXF83065.1 glycolate oxidase iron-sulfur subunit [Enterovibrio coralii]
MKTSLEQDLLQTHAGQTAEDILRKCVHCGFCNATCPTYQELNDERDGPRGRIYLIKNMLEGEEFSAKTQKHLDRCLTCRNCETTCPSGVQYSILLDIGREHIEKHVPRPLKERLMRFVLTRFLPNRKWVNLGFGVLNTFRSVLPEHIKSKLPKDVSLRYKETNARASRTMIGFQGCVQSSLTPNTLAAAKKVLSHLDIALITVKNEGCCGALNLHLAERERAIKQAKENIDNWWPYIESGAETIVISASGCGVSIKDYPSLFIGDEIYYSKAEKVASLAKDLSEVILAEDTATLPFKPDNNERLAVHCPCTLHHGLKLKEEYASVFKKLGFHTVPTNEDHLCCGSAGSYSLLQPELSNRLKKRKLGALSVNNPDVIVTANIGCQLHLESGTEKPVKHWIEMVADRLED